jgi:cytochrome c biogenesis protein CcmG, thiol:disulfide interchange protein DsbE
VKARVVVRAGAVVAVAALGAVLVWHLTHQPPSVAPQVARHEVVAAPNFDLARLSGPGKLSLSSLRGKAVVVNFWASDCGPCKEEMPRLVSFAGRWADRDVVVVGIDVDELRKGPAQAFARRYKATYPMVFDPNGSTVDPWGVGEGTPQTFFVDRRGRIVDHVLGPVSSAALTAGAAHALRS